MSAPAGAANLFVCDDEETLSCLLASSSSTTTSDAATTTLQRLLQGLPKRFLDDHYQQRQLEDCWEDLLAETAREVSLDLGNERQQEAHLTVPPSVSSVKPSTPAALATEVGRAHVEATRAILSAASDNDAIQLSLGALRSVSPDIGVAASDSSWDHNSSSSTFFSSLLGTRALLLKVVGYAYKQRIARLQVIAECLRVEMETSEQSRESGNDTNKAASDPATNTIHENVVQSLNDIDESYKMNTTSTMRSQRNRGLFRILLQVATQPDMAFTRDQLWPAKKLTKRTQLGQSLFSSSASVTAVSIDRDQDDSQWNQFVAKAAELKRHYVQRERLEAMEGLLALLYDRIEKGNEDGLTGITRGDFLILLIALFDPGRGKHQTQEHVGAGRLSQLKGLICVEALSLWKVFDTQSSGGSVWVFSHPILDGLLSSDQQLLHHSEHEIKAIVSRLQRLGHYAVERRRQESSSQQYHSQQTMSGIEIPESLALLSFGLLLCVAYPVLLESPSVGSDVNGYWQNFASIGQELTEFANDQCQSFDYLYHVLSQLVERIDRLEHQRLPSCMPNISAGPYELQYFGTNDGSDGMLRTDVNQEAIPLLELSAPSLVYASIGRELLALVVFAFRDTILSIQHPAAIDNIGMLCSLASNVFCNSPSLCLNFWESWDAYTSPSSGASSETDIAARKESLPLCCVMDSAYSIANAALLAQQTKTSDKVLEGITPLLSMVSSLAFDSSAVETIVTSILPPGLIRLSLVLCASSTVGIDSRKGVLESVCRLVQAAASESTRKLLRDALEDVEPGASNISGPRLLVACGMQLRDDHVSSRICSILSELTLAAPEVWVVEVANSLEFGQAAGHGKSGLFIGSDPGAFATASNIRLMHALIGRLGNVVFSDRLDEDMKIGFFTLVGGFIEHSGATLCKSLSSLSKEHGLCPIYSTVRASIVCMVDCLMVLRPSLQLLESPPLLNAAASLCTSIVTALASNQGLGDTVLYYAVSPVLLSLASQLDDHLNDSMVFTGTSASSYQSFGGEANGSSIKFLVDALSNLSTLGLDLEMVRRKGWLHPSDMGHVLPAAVDAIRLLNVWARTVEDMVIGEDKDFDLLALSPYRFLAVSSGVPPVCRDSNALRSHLTSAQISNFSLMVRYLNKRDPVPCATSLSAGCFDLFFISANHSKIAAKGDYSFGDSMVRAFMRSGGLKSVVKEYVDSAVELGEVERFSESQNVELSICLRCLRFVSVCIDADPTTGTKLLGSDPSAVTSSLCDVTIQCMKYFVPQSNSRTSSFDDGVVLNHLRLANGCLEVILSLWKYGRSSSVGDGNLQASMEPLRTLVEKQTRVLTYLSSWVFDAAVVLNGDTLSEQRESCVIASVTHLALEILSSEMAWSCGRPDVNSLPIISGLERSMERDLSRFIAAFEYVLTANGYAGYAESLKQLSEFCPVHGSVVPLSLSRLHELSMTSSRICQDPFTDCNGRDFRMIEKFFLEINPSSTVSQSVTSSVKRTLSARNFLHCEIIRIGSWRRFTEFLSMLLNHLRHLEPTHSMLSMSRESFVTGAIEETAGSLHENMCRVETTQLDFSPLPLIPEALLVAQALTSILLHFTGAKEASWKMSRREWNRIVVSLCECCRKLVAVLGGRTNGWHIPVQQLLVSTAVVLTLEPAGNSMSHDEKTNRDRVQVGIVRTTCEVIRGIDRLVAAENPSFRAAKMYRDCLTSCVSIVTMLTVAVDPGEGMSVSGLRHSYGTQLINVFRDCNTISSLVRQVCGLQVVDDADHRAIGSILNFFGSVAACGDQNAVSLLVESDLSALLARCSVYFCENSTNSSCGYLPLRRLNAVPPSASVGMDDPVHSLWVGCMKLLSSALRTCSFGPPQKDATTDRLLSIAMDSLRCNRSHINECFQQCTVIGSSTKTFALTFNALQEAASIISVASELCSRRFLDTFKLHCPELLDGILHYAKGLLVNISCFLGASAASRELFRTMEEFERADSLTAEQHEFTPMRPAIQLVTSTGVRNAKHEAIRFSHFVSRASSAITENEVQARAEFSEPWKPFGSSAETDPHSLSSLERNCRCSVSSKFAFDLEQVASECLFFATQLLWTSHPASVSFRTIPEEHIGNVDAMPLVHPGMVIAFRQGGQRPGKLLSLMGNDATSSANQPSQQFGEVLYADTVNRCWHVRTPGCDENEQERVVYASQITGIEDTTKRSCVLSYVPAPESSSDLESSMGSASVGHLILILRWCHQSRVEQSAGAAPANDGFGVVERLAELTSAFLGTELSIHRKIGSQMDQSKSEMSKMIAAQVMDLYGDAFDAADMPVGESGVADWMNGRLKGLVSPAMWKAARGQLQPELEQARIAVETKRKESSTRRIPNENHSFVGVRRNSGTTQSPFRGIVGM